MTPRTDDARALELLREMTPEILRVLTNCPSYGSVGFVAHFHEGELVRTTVSAEVSRKPRTGGTR